MRRVWTAGRAGAWLGKDAAGTPVLVTAVTPARRVGRQKLWASRYFSEVRTVTVMVNGQERAWAECIRDIVGRRGGGIVRVARCGGRRGVHFILQALPALGTHTKAGSGKYIHITRACEPGTHGTHTRRLP